MSVKLEVRVNHRYRNIKDVEVSGWQASSVVFSPLASCQELARNLQVRGHLVRTLESSAGGMIPLRPEQNLDSCVCHVAGCLAFSYSVLSQVSFIFLSYSRRN